MAGYSRRQVFIFMTLAVENVCNSLCFAIQAPFYPSVAESKGVTPTQYGLVFGVYQLAMFLTAPIFGQFITAIGSKRMLVTGIFVAGTSCILFSVLIFIEHTKTFLAFSFLIRIVEAIGHAGCFTASFSIIAQEFPETIGSTMATLETFVGVGLIVGPTVGGFLYELGGFITPFITFGVMMVLCSVFTGLFLPSTDFTSEIRSKTNSIMLLRIPEITISMLANLAAANNIGFLQATLEPHIRFLSLPPYLLGLMFIISGGTFAIFAPLWGKICDKGVYSILLHVFASLIIIFSFLLIGPAPFIPLEPSLPLIIVALSLNGVGMGGQLIPSFSGAHKFAVSAGLPRSMSTLGLISGMWASCFSLGAFMGPTIAGALMDSYGYRNSTLYIISLHSLVCLISIVFICFRRQQSSGSDEFSLLNHTDDSKLSVSLNFDHSESSERCCLTENVSIYGTTHNSLL